MGLDALNEAPYIGRVLIGSRGELTIVLPELLELARQDLPWRFREAGGQNDRGACGRGFWLKAAADMIWWSWATEI